MAKRGWLRGSALAALVVALMAGGVAWLGPLPSRATADPKVALGAGNPVPAPVMSVLRRGCFDCHSDETRWPWYARIPPSSWLVLKDVERGRAQINFSRWGLYNPFDQADLLDKVCELASKRKMPLLPYRLMHAEARLADSDIATLCAWTAKEAARLVNGGA